MACTKSNTDYDNQMTCKGIFQTFFLLIVLDGFAVTQQSPSMVYKSQSESTIPIFCVASSHHFDFNYTWNKGGFHVGTNSPVYYSSTSGIYKCTVTDHMLNQNCCSHAIQVAGKLKANVDFAMCMLCLLYWLGSGYGFIVLTFQCVHVCLTTTTVITYRRSRQRKWSAISPNFCQFQE